MRFHDYITLRNQMAKFGHDEGARKIGKSVTSDEFRQFFLSRRETLMQSASLGQDSLQVFDRLCAVTAEQIWVDDQRPFYNVWPIAENLARDVKLDLPFSAVEIPFDSIVLRFALGSEPYNIATAMLFWPNTHSFVNVLCYFPGTMDRLTFRYDYEPNETVEHWLQRIATDSAGHEWRATEGANSNANSTAASLMVRLVVFIGLLANDQDMITPVVLSEDRKKYESTDDVEVKKWLESRAKRKLGRGFDVGKKLQAERDASPHWRNPHLCLFWTGPGRTKPVIRMRSGSVVQRVSMAAVPTGYLGPESQDEDAEGGTYIYFVEAVGQDRIKIGKADDPEARVRQLQTGSAVELRLLAVMTAQPSQEAELHTAFAKERCQGEWFRATEELRGYIARFAGEQTP
ncbi:MAG TPA: GIY-YIG nuclease family protein [Gemmataceae bacterium]|nr:GIY-YIG nuclease family protein [Gemmataceae bacterium]